MKLEIKLGETKTVSIRSSVEILDHIGDIGGFVDAMHLIFGFVGSYFSAKFIFASMAGQMFV